MREKYETLPLATLKDLAKARGLRGISTMKKAQLIDRMVEEDEKEKKEEEKKEEEKKPEEKRTVTKKLKNAKKMSKCNKTGVCSGGQAGPGCHRAQRLLTNAR